MRQLYHIPRQINQYMRVFKIPEYIKEHPEVQKKYAMVVRAEHARASEGVSFTCSARILNVAPSTLYAWRRCIYTGSIGDLIPQSRRPRSVRKTTLVPRTIDRFKELRHMHLGLGGRKIAAILQKEGHTISFSQADRLITNLLDTHTIVPARSWVPNKSEHRKRKRAPYVPVIAKKPGDLVQLDTVHLINYSRNTRSVFQMNAIDVVSRMTVSKIYYSCTSENACDFMRHVRQVLPFSIHHVQTDGGSEFQGSFRTLCAHAYSTDALLKHITIPPRSPKINGCIERFNGICRQELWHCVDARTVGDMRRVVQEYHLFYNNTRPHMALGYKTPVEALTQWGHSP